MKRFILTGILALLLLSVFARDKITRMDGSKVNCNIINVDSTRVELDYFGNGKKVRTYIDIEHIKFIEINGYVYYRGSFDELYDLNKEEGNNSNTTGEPVDSGLRGDPYSDYFRGFYLSPKGGIHDQGGEIGIIVDNTIVNIEGIFFELPEKNSRMDDLTLGIKAGKYYGNRKARFRYQGGIGYSIINTYNGLYTGPYSLKRLTAMTGIGTRFIFTPYTAVGFDVKFDISPQHYYLRGVLVVEFGKLRKPIFKNP